MKVYIILISILIAMFFLSWFILTLQVKHYQNKIKHLYDKLKVYETLRNNENEKNKMHTDDNNYNFNNSIELLQKYTNNTD